MVAQMKRRFTVASASACNAPKGRGNLSASDTIAHQQKFLRRLTGSKRYANNFSLATICNRWGADCHFWRARMGPTFGWQDVRLRKDGLRRKNQHEENDIAPEENDQSHVCESCQQNDERGVGLNRRQVVDIGQWLRRFRSSIYPKRF